MKAYSAWCLLVRGFRLLVLSSIILVPFFSTDFYGSQAPDNRIKFNVAHVSLRPYGTENSGGVLWLKELLFRFIGWQGGYFNTSDAVLFSLDYPALEKRIGQGSLQPGNDPFINNIIVSLENEAAQLISFSGVTPEMVEQIAYAYYLSVKPAISVASGSLYQFQSPVLHLRYHRYCQLLIVSKFPVTNDWQYITPYKKRGKSLEDWLLPSVDKEHDPFTYGVESFEGIVNGGIFQGKDKHTYEFACSLPVRVSIKGTSLVLVNASITSMKNYDLACKAEADRQPGCLKDFLEIMRNRFSPYYGFDTSVKVDEVLLFTGFWGAGINHHCKKGYKDRLPKKFRLKDITRHMGVVLAPVQQDLMTLAAVSDDRVKAWYKWHRLKPPECDYMADFIGHSIWHKSFNLWMSPLRSLKVTPEPADKAYGIVYRTMEITP